MLDEPDPQRLARTVQPHHRVVRREPELARNGPARLALVVVAQAALAHVLGLSFHADHHVRASRAFGQLELRDESPQVPRGYFTTAAMVLFQRARALLTAQLPLTRLFNRFIE